MTDPSVPIDPAAPVQRTALDGILDGLSTDDAESLPASATGLRDLRVLLEAERRMRASAKSAEADVQPAEAGGRNAAESEGAASGRSSGST